jgi:hypothetical protein
MKTSSIRVLIALLLGLAAAFPPASWRLVAGVGKSCPLDFGGLRAFENYTNGAWYGFQPFETSPGVLDTEKIESKYLRWTERVYATGNHSASTNVAAFTESVLCGGGTVTGNWAAGTRTYVGSLNYDISKTDSVTVNGSSLGWTYFGTDQLSSVSTDPRTNWHTCGGVTYRTRDRECSYVRNLTITNGAYGAGRVLGSVTDQQKHFRESPTPAQLIVTGGSSAIDDTWEDFPGIANLTLNSTSPTELASSGVWVAGNAQCAWDTQDSEYTVTVQHRQTLSDPDTRSQLRDRLLSRLDATNEWQAFGVATASFAVEADASAGHVQGIRDLKVFVLGVKDRKYRVWYSKEIVRKTGEVSKTEEYQTVVGEGMETEAFASIAAEPPPAEGGSITYRYTRVTEEGDDSPDKGAGAPGSMAVSGLPDAGGMDAGGCSSCGSGMGNLTGHSGVGFKTSMGFGGGGFASGSIDWQVSKPKGGSLDKGSIGFPALGGGKNWIDAGKTHVLTDQAFAAVTNIPAGGFGISLYRSSAVASTNASGVTLVSGAVADLVIRVEPEVAGLLDGRKIQVTATPAGGTARVTYFRAIDGLPEGVIEWAVTHPGNTLEYRWRQEMASDLSRTSRMEWGWPGTTNVVRTETSHFVPSQRGEVVLWQTSGMGSETRTNLFEYHAFTGYPEKDGRLKVAQQWDGSWVEFDYDAQGRQVIERRSWDDGAYGAATVVRQKTLGYTPIPGSGDTGLAVHENSVRSEVEQIGTQVMAVRWKIHGSDFVREIEGASPTSAWNDPANRVTTTYHRPTGHAQAGEVWKISHADGRLSLITRTSSGTTNTVTTTEGKPNAGGTAIVDGIASTTVRGGFGETLAQTNFVIANSVLTPTAILVHENFDEFRRYRRQRYLDGTYVDRDFACCGIDSKIDREGVISTLIRDPALRVIGRYRLGILETNLLDPAGNVLSEVRVGTNGTAMTLASRGYDSTGTLRAETNALGGITRWGWSYATNGAILLTRTNPVGAVRVELYARDGRLRQIGGSEPAPVRYEYYTDYRDVGLGFPEEFVVEKAIALDANGTDTAETTTIYKDSHGQVRMIQRGAFG